MNNQNLETTMKQPLIIQWALAGLLAAGLTVAQAQAVSPHTADSAASSTPKASEAASGKKKAKKASKPQAAASNPGTSGGAGNRSGNEAKDGASFEAPRPKGAASKPTGTGWD